ncbi:MAG: family 16 glycosylhydrolase, partial [Gammaproteobacteria bacterium]|nr:family 16 glycosylhydrolase [Gammaproteobacteria bacterium]
KLKKDRAQERADKLHERALRKAGWKRVFKDEFKGKRIREKNWSHEVNCWGGGNNEKQCYTDRPENSYVKDGMLHIVAREESFSGPGVPDDDPAYNPNDASVTLPYTSARLRSKGKVDFTYGRVEVRAKLPAGQGMWPANWMLPTDYEYGIWPSSGEIDITEAVNLGVWPNEVHGTLHYGLKWPQWENHGQTLPLDVNPADDFHVYAIEWEADEIRWYVDGVHYQTQRSEGWYNYIWQGQDKGFGVANPRAPFDQDFHLILNLAAGGDWPGDPDTNWLEDRAMLVDYVRVYECRKPKDKSLRRDGTGSGCGTIDESIAVNTDAGAPGINDFLIYADGVQTLELGNTTNTVQPGFWELNEGSLVAADTGDYWDITFGGLGNVFLSAEDMSEVAGYDTGVALSGGSGWTNNGEVEFDMLVTHAEADSVFTVKIDSGWPNLGEKVIETPPVGEWQKVAVKVSDLMANPNPNGGGVDISNIQNLFVLEYSGSGANVQIDNIRLQCAVNTEPESWQLDQLCDMEPKTAAVEPVGDVIDVYIDEVTQWDLFSCCGGAEIAQIDVDGNNVMEFTYDNDPSTNTVTFFQSAGPIDMSAFAGGTVEFDMYVVSQPSNPAADPWIMKTDCEHPCGSGDVPLTASVEGVLPPTGAWQHYTFQLTDLVARGLELNHVDTPLVIFPAWGSQDGAQFLIDNVQIKKGMTSQATLPVDFETVAGVAYSFGDFEGGVGSVVDNPQVDADNGSAKVGQLQKFGGGNVWAGSTLDIEGDIDFSASEVFTMKVRSATTTDITFKLEGANVEEVVTYTGSGEWQTLTFDFTGRTGGAPVSAITLIQDNGTAGDAQNDPARWTIHFDDITLGGGVVPMGPFDVTFTVDMSESGMQAGAVAYVNGTFNGWCGNCNPLTDMGGGLWGVTIPLAVDSYEYKFTINGWDAQESVPVECGLVGGDMGQFVNRVVDVVDANVDLSTTPYSGCPTAGNTGPFNVTFAVDMSDSGMQAGDVAYVNGTFNGWCGDCNPLTDMGGGLWGVTIPLDVATYEYKFTINGWAAQEAVPAECGLTTGEFTNRVVDVVDANVDLPNTPYSGCPTAGNTGPFNVTFAVDMSAAGMQAGDVAFVNGTFNGWCGDCNPLTDMGGGLWGVTIPLDVATYEYKFTINGWAAQEAVPAECGLTTGEFTNRVVDVVDTAVDLAVTPYSGCPGGTGGGGGGGGGGADGELAVNGGFETGDLSGWTVFDNGGVIAASMSEANTGTYSGNVYAGPFQNPVIKQANLAVGTVAPGDSVTISFDLFGTLAGAGGVVFAELFSEGAVVGNEILGGGPLFPSTTWTSYSFTTTAGSDVSGGITLQLAVICGGDPACAVDAFFDNVSVTINP